MHPPPHTHTLTSNHLLPAASVDKLAPVHLPTVDAMFDSRSHSVTALTAGDLATGGESLRAVPSDAAHFP